MLSGIVFDDKSALEKEHLEQERKERKDREKAKKQKKDQMQPAQDDEAPVVAGIRYMKPEQAAAAAAAGNAERAQQLAKEQGRELNEVNGPLCFASS
eukprot:gene13639-13762_t